MFSIRWWVGTVLLVIMIWPAAAGRAQAPMASLVPPASLAPPTAQAPPAAAPPAQAPTAATGLLTGLVTGVQGQPLPAATLELYQLDTGLVASADTGADGAFRLDLPAGGAPVYWLRAWATGYDVAEELWVPSDEVPWLHVTLRALRGDVSVLVLGPDAEPVRGAGVELWRTGYELLAATTDGQGRARLAAVPAGGPYRLQVQASGLLPATVAVADAPAGGGTGATVTLAPATGVISGVVVNQVTGAPVPGAAVAVEHTELGAVTAAAAVTAADGTFRLTVPNAAAARFRLQASNPGFGAAVTADFALDERGTARFDGAQRLALAPLTATVLGRAVNDDREAVAGLTVWLEREQTGIVGTATVAARDGFRFDGVVADGTRYRLRAAPDAFVTNVGSLKHWAPAASDWFTPAPGQAQSVSLALTGGTVSNYGDGWVRGRVTTPTGQAVAGAAVALIRSGDGVVATATTDGDGAYRFTGVKANVPEPTDPATAFFRWTTSNAYVVRASQEGHYGALSDSVSLRRDTEAVADLTLRPETGTVSILAVDPDGRPLAAAAVLVHPDRGGDPLRARTDAGGRAWVAAPAPGTYRVQVEGDGYRRFFAAAVDVVPGQDTAVTASLASAAGTLSGRVTDATGLPRSGVRVAVAASGRPDQATTTDAGGYYRLGDLPAGQPLFLVASQAGARPAAPAAAVILTPGQQQRVDLEVQDATGTVAGRVLNAQARPVAGTTVSLWQAGTGAVATARTDAAGAYRFTGVAADPDRSYTVRLGAAGVRFRQVGRRTPPELFRLGPGETRHVVLVQLPDG